MEKVDLDKIDCKIIKDKTLSRHDALYKLILIGDTCKFQINLGTGFIFIRHIRQTKIFTIYKSGNKQL